MPTTMALWQLGEDGSAVLVPEEPLSAETQIEAAVESAPQLLGVDVLIVGRQVRTSSGPLDLLAIDAAGHLVVIENKRDRTPREVLAQTIDYAAYVSTLTFEDVATIYQAYRQRFGEENADLAEACEEHFGESLDGLADTPRMIIVASRLDDATERMIEFLAVRFGLPVNALIFQPFAGSSDRTDMASARRSWWPQSAGRCQRGVARRSQAVLGRVASNWTCCSS